MSTYISKVPVWLLYRFLILVILDFYFQIQIYRNFFFYVVSYKPNAYMYYPFLPVFRQESSSHTSVNTGLFFLPAGPYGFVSGRESMDLLIYCTLAIGWRFTEVRTRCIDPDLELSV